MPESSDFDVRYLAELARLELTDEEAATFESQLARILEHVRRLESIDISGIEPTAHATPVYDIMREDEPGECLPREAALRNAPRERLDQMLDLALGAMPELAATQKRTLSELDIDIDRLLP